MPRRRLRLLRLAAECPECGARPAIRLYPWTPGQYRDWPGGKPVEEYQCRAHGCRTRYIIHARAYQDAA